MIPDSLFVDRLKTKALYTFVSPWLVRVLASVVRGLGPTAGSRFRVMPVLVQLGGFSASHAKFGPLEALLYGVSLFRR